MEEVENTPVEISDYPVRRRKILRTYDFIPPKFYGRKNKKYNPTKQKVQFEAW